MKQVVGNLLQARVALLATAAVAEELPMHVFIANVLISPASALAGDCLFIIRFNTACYRRGRAHIRNHFPLQLPIVKTFDSFPGFQTGLKM